MAARPGRPATVRVRLTILAALLAGLGLVAGGLVMLALVRHSLMDNARNDALNRAQSTVEMLVAGELPGTLPSSGENPAVVQVVDRDGRVLTASEGPARRARAAVPLARRRRVDRDPEGRADRRGRGLHGRRPGRELAGAATRQRSPAGELAGAATRQRSPAGGRAGERVAVYAASALEPVSEGVGAAATALAAVVPVLLWSWSPAPPGCWSAGRCGRWRLSASGSPRSPRRSWTGGCRSPLPGTRWAGWPGP